MSQTRENRSTTGLTQIWLTAPAGLAGLLLLIAAEISGGPTQSDPIPRYKPAGYNSSGLIAASQDIAIVVAPTVQALEAAFKQAGYDLDKARDGGATVPHLRLPMLPRDLPDMRDVQRRKKIFFSIALPLILEANARVAVERKRLLYVVERIEAGAVLPAEEQDWLSRLSERYDSEPDDLDELLRRVDVAPASLAMAQAATESGWGSSRFAQRGNALFGQWTTAGGRGLVPHEREEGKTHKVRSFDSLTDSAAAYLLNLNTHRAYRHFRARRAEMRAAGETLDGMLLAEELKAYSERGSEYVKLLQDMIRRDNLIEFEKARLGERVIEFTPGV